MNDALQQLLDRLTALLAEKPLIGAWYTTVVRFVFPLLALMILVGAIRSLWKVKHPDEVWGYLVLRNGVRLPITHWENIIGRAPSCDVQLEYPSVSRQHAALIREDTTVLPDSGRHAAYEPFYRLYCDLYPALKVSFHRLAGR